mmetsp:Transcript_29710/g.89956  ORF Transcript_29710/g.89956 Transcript_29710/m.89956 type:complete len:218 (-) Transcript_29710:125-778(-)
MHSQWRTSQAATASACSASACPSSARASSCAGQSASNGPRHWPHCRLLLRSLCQGLRRPPQVPFPPGLAQGSWSGCASGAFQLQTRGSCAPSFRGGFGKASCPRISACWRRCQFTRHRGGAMRCPWRLHRCESSPQTKTGTRHCGTTSATTWFPGRARPGPFWPNWARTEAPPPGFCMSSRHRGRGSSDPRCACASWKRSPPSARRHGSRTARPRTS